MHRHMKTQTALASLCLLLLAAGAQAQVSQEWVRSYDGDHHDNDRAGLVAVDLDGNVIVSGQSEGGFLTIKYQADGDTAWIRREPGAPAGSPTGLVVDDGGNVYVTGYTYTGSAYWGDEYVTFKYDASGATQWGAAYNGDGGAGGDVARALAVDRAGCVYVTGYATRAGLLGITTLKYDPDGGLSATWPDVGLGCGVRRYAVSGQSGYQAGIGIAVDDEGNVYIAGVSAPATGTPNDYLTIKYDAGGDEMWTRRYDATGNEDTPVAVALDDSSNVIVAGTSYAPVSGVPRPDYATIKYDTNGIQKWIARFDGPAHYDDLCAALAVDGAGNIYVTGVASCLSADYATVRYNRTGQQVWVQYHDAAEHGEDQAAALAIGQDGGVVVTGKVQTESLWDVETVRYNDQGQESWCIRYSGPEHQGDRPAGIALDDLGNIYVAGTSGSANCWDDYVTIRYVPVPSGLSDGRPATIASMRNEPNPFHAATRISYVTARPQTVSLKVYDLAGREVATLADGEHAAGMHSRVFRGERLPSGAYLCRLKAGGFTTTWKILLAR